MLTAALREMDTRPLHYHYYSFMNQEDHDYSNHRIEDMKNKIDMVPFYMIAGLRTAQLAAAVYRNPAIAAALGKGMRFIDPEAKGDNNVPLDEENTEEIQRKRRQKGIAEKPEAKSTKIGSSAVRLLWAKGKGLFQQGRKFVPPETLFSTFFVWKKNGLMRVIMDCRWTNVLLKSSEAKFSFFQFEALRQVIDNLSAHPKWYAVNMDLRHWFHQIPLPDRYKKRLGYRMIDQRELNFFLFPRACPMGWTMSPLIGQCCTWALVLVTPNNSRNHDRKFDLPAGDVLAKNTTPFTWIPLNQGGGIFVLLDNILVATPSETVAHAWIERIVENCNTFHAVLNCKANKDAPANASEPSPLNDIEALKSECLFELTPNNNCSFNFTGVDWFHGSRIVKSNKPGDGLEVPDVRDPKAENFRLNYDPESGTWTGEHRELASVLGRLMWHRRVHDIRFYDRESESKAIRSAFAKVTPPTGKRWQDSVTLTKEETAGICSAWKLRARQTPTQAEPLTEELERVLWVVGDAATNEKTGLPPQIAVVAIDPETAQLCKPIIVDCFPSDWEIALGELLVILTAVRKYSSSYQLIVLATDSMTAKHWVENRNAHNEQALVILAEIEALLRQNKCRLYLVYVNTLDNAADLPSRIAASEARVEERHLTATCSLLRSAAFEAKGMWSKSGGLVGGSTYNIRPRCTETEEAVNDGKTSQRKTKCYVAP